MMSPCLNVRCRMLQRKREAFFSLLQSEPFFGMILAVNLQLMMKINKLNHENENELL